MNWDRDKILEVLSNKSLYELDQMLQAERLKINGIIGELAKAREDELSYKFAKRKELLSEGNSPSKVENILRSDELLYNLKKKIIGLVALKAQSSNKIEVIRSYYFSNRNTGG